MKVSVHISHFVEGKYLSGQRGAAGWGKILLMCYNQLDSTFSFSGGRGKH